MTAGGKASFTATGVDANGNKTAGDLNIVGSDVNAKQVALKAAHDVNIVSATDTEESHSRNESSSVSVGVSYGFGQGQGGFGVSASASKSKGNSDGTGATQVNSHVNGSESVSIASGNDTNVQGGVVSGGKVMADVGGNLNLASRQDTSETHAKQDSMGGGFSISQGGGSASFSASRGRADGTYANVTEQSGIRAGDGGFDINVKGNTDLKGAVIASTATPDKNQLTTGTLTWSDVKNHSEYSADSMGVSMGGTFGGTNSKPTSGQESGKNTGGISPMIPQSESGSQSGVAQAAISAGSITITNKDAQKQDVSTLNRDTTNTNTTVGKNPDLNDLLGKQADMMAAAQAAGEAVAKTVGDIADKKYQAAKDRYKAAVNDDDPVAAAAAKADMDNWDVKGDYRAALHMAGGALIAGLGGGNAVAGAVGAGVTTKLSSQLGNLAQSVASNANTGNADVNEMLGNIAANIAAGGIGLAVGGGSGAATAANVDRFNRQIHQNEQALARKLADQSHGQYTEAQVADALRLANNKALGENVASNVSVDVSKNPDGYYDGAYMQKSDGKTFVQNTNAIAKPSSDLMNYISSMTGGNYTWDTAPATSTKSLGSGQVFSTNNPLIGGGCVTAECSAGLANSGPSPMRPDYATVGSGSLSAAGSVLVNLHDGTTYLAGGVAQSDPRGVSFKPGLAGTVGWILGARDASSTNSFLYGDGNQAYISIPTPWKGNLYMALTHAYGGSTALEVGAALPGKLSFGLSPFSHSTPIIKPGSN